VSLVSKLTKMGFAVWFAFSQILLGTTAAYAQSDLIDVEPPLIEHAIADAVDATFRQSFVATVVDDGELDNVSLYFRFQGDPAYGTVLMQRVSYSSTYIVHIPTEPDSSRNIEYYIQARDKAGNRTVRGYAFNPLLREINLPSSVAEPAPTQASPTMFESIGKRKTAVYVVLGVLVAGAIASQIDLGGGKSTSTACAGTTCRVKVEVGQP